jgi:hypothetical protein
MYILKEGMKNIYRLPTKWEWKGVHFLKAGMRMDIHFLEAKMDNLMYISWNVCHKEWPFLHEDNFFILPTLF